MKLRHRKATIYKCDLCGNTLYHHKGYMTLTCIGCNTVIKKNVILNKHEFENNILKVVNPKK